MSSSNPLLRRNARVISQYGAAVLSVAAALFLTHWPPLHLQASPLVLSLCAVVFSAWLGGIGPGALAAALSAFAFYYSVLSPPYSLTAKTGELPRFFAFVFSTVLVGTLTVVQRWATESLRQARDHLAERIQELKKTNKSLTTSEAYLVEAQRLSQTGSFGWRPSTGEIIWSEETFRIFQYDRTTTPTVELIFQRIHPEDAALVRQTIERASQDGKDIDIEHRLRMPDGSVKHLRVAGHPSKDESGSLEFVGAVMDVSDHKRAEDKLRRSEADLLDAQRMSRTGSLKVDISSGTVTGSPQVFRIFGVKPDEDTSTAEFWLSRTHPEDQKRIRELFDRSIIQKTDFDAEYRIVLPGGAIKYLHSLGRPILNESGDLAEFGGTIVDITERMEAQEALRRSEHNLNLIINTIPALAWSARTDGSANFFNKHYLDFVGLSAEQMQDWGWTVAVHPDDLNSLAGTWQSIMASGKTGEAEARLCRFDGEYRWFLFRANPLCNEIGNIVEWFGINTDIEDRKRAEEKLRRSEADLLEAQRISHTGSWKLDISSGTVTGSPQMFRIYGVKRDEDPSNFELWFGRTHVEDRKRMLEIFERSKIQKTDYDADYRIVLPDGEVKHIHTIGHPVLNESGDLIEFVGTNLDITERKQAEEKIRQSEREARQLIDLSPIHIGELGPGGTPERVYNNKTALDYFGVTLEQWRAADWKMLVHPQEAERVLREFPIKFLNGSSFEDEVRLKRRDGQYRWFHFRINPMRDEQGRITRWYSVGTDIEDRKVAEQRLQEENVALREEIDKASMFEEIVGTSAPLRKVLSLLSRVAPTDSTVLVTGETGTGKELVARAIHRNSARSSYAFVSVNCAAIPRDLIASELFGHEKGSFTGATQRRLGRFELAEKGTIFLDEIGELPAETQIALLRVLQEHEFERVGGIGSIPTDVRVIAATNRDLEAAIAAGMFRSDLFYRLNVFPIEMPPLRERRDDILLLVEYFIDRYARKAGKSFQTVNKKTLDLLQAYPWAGNIRELQNVIERSVIVCDTESFSVDESWLSREPLRDETKNHLDLSRKLAAQEKEIIEAALRDSGGRVSGRSGAAAKLGIPGPTLESKIRSLKIDKYRFKTTVSSRNRMK